MRYFLTAFHDSMVLPVQEQLSSSLSSSRIPRLAQYSQVSDTRANGRCGARFLVAARSTTRALQSRRYNMQVVQSLVLRRLACGKLMD